MCFHQLTTAGLLPQQQQQHPHIYQNNNVASQQQQQQQQQSQQQNTSRYKTELCRPYEENGTCKYGEKCQFAHGVSELRTLTRHPKYKTEFCRTFHTTGFCPYGPRCHFIHNSKTSAPQAPAAAAAAAALSSLGARHYNSLPFGRQASHSASPSTSPISSSSSVRNETDGENSSHHSHSNNNHHHHHHHHGDHSSRNKTSSSGSSTTSSSSSSSGVDGTNGVCPSETQRLFWLHSHMNESSRRPPTMCASELISGNARRTWQMQAWNSGRRADSGQAGQLATVTASASAIGFMR